jgi:integrase/recombinase XerD
VSTEQSAHADILTTDEIWLAALRAAGRSPATIASYRHAIGCLQQWRGTTELDDVTRAEAYGFVQWLGDNYKSGGVAIRVRSLRAYYGWLVKEELIDKNPFTGITVSVPAEAKLTPSEDQIDAMLAKAKGHRRDHALLMLLVDSGARKGEVAALTVKDVDLASGLVTFRVSKTVARTVPLTDRCIVALGKWLRERGDGGGSLWGVADPYSLVRAVLDRYSEFTPHSLRRAAAVRALRAGMSVPSIERLFGWRAGSAMLQTYVAAHADSIAHEEFARLMH